jgi:predicted nucleic acid-binding Zn ribbon protein
MKKLYEYACHKCRILWEKEYNWGNPAQKTKCPECGKRCGQNWLDRPPPPVHFKGAGWTGVNSVTGFNKKGGSDEINLKLQEGCKERMKTGWQHYAKYTPKQAYMDDHVKRKLSPEESLKKIENAKKQASRLYDKAGINPYTQATKKPQ